MSVFSETFHAPSLGRPTAIGWLKELSARQSVLTGAGVLLAAAMLPMGFASLLDARLFNGIDLWIKPLKFALAVAIYMFTLAFFASWVEEATRTARWFRGLAWATASAGTLEVFYIALQASRDEASHFNYTDNLHMALYGLMGIGAVLMIGFSAVLGILIARNRRLDVAPAIRDAVVLGLTLSFVLTLVPAGTMSAMGSHWIGGVHSDAGGMALTGWSRDGGDLRVAHLFGTHAMHFIPAFGVVSALVLGPEKRWPVWLFALLFCGFVAFLFFQALAGQPFLPWLH